MTQTTREWREAMLTDIEVADADAWPGDCMLPLMELDDLRKLIADADRAAELERLYTEQCRETIALQGQVDRLRTERNEMRARWENALECLVSIANVAGEALGTDPELRTATGCVEALAGAYQQSKDDYELALRETEKLRTERDRLRGGMDDA